MVNKEPVWIIRDTREKQDYGWTFNKSDVFAGMKKEALESGDYTLSVFQNEKFLWIDRKHSWSEIVMNLFGKEDRHRFYECLERTRLYKYKYIILEVKLDDIYYIKIPKLRIKPDAILKKLIEISIEYNINIIFASKYGHIFCLSLLKRMLERWNKIHEKTHQTSI